MAKSKKKSKKNKKHKGAHLAPAAGMKKSKRGSAQDMSFDAENGVAGFIFVCTAKTKPDCYLNRVFGLPKKKMELVKRIRPDAFLFLFDIELKILYGIYRAISNGGENLVPQAFGGAFPWQVRFKIEKDCLPLREDVFKHAMLENYRSKSKFHPTLNPGQVLKLLSLFKCVSLPPRQPPSLPAAGPTTLAQQQLPVQQNIEDQRQPSSSDSCRWGCSACAPTAAPPPPHYAPPPHTVWHHPPPTETHCLHHHHAQPEAAVVMPPPPLKDGHYPPPTTTNACYQGEPPPPPPPHPRTFYIVESVSPHERPAAGGFRLVPETRIQLLTPTEDSSLAARGPPVEQNHWLPLLTAHQAPSQMYVERPVEVQQQNHWIPPPGPSSRMMYYPPAPQHHHH